MTEQMLECYECKTTILDQEPENTGWRISFLHRELMRCPACIQKEKGEENFAELTAKHAGDGFLLFSHRYRLTIAFRAWLHEKFLNTDRIDAVDLFLIFLVDTGCIKKDRVKEVIKDIQI